MDTSLRHKNHSFSLKSIAKVAISFNVKCRQGGYKPGKLMIAKKVPSIEFCSLELLREKILSALEISGKTQGI